MDLEQETGRAVGTVQATLPAGRPAASLAEVAAAGLSPTSAMHNGEFCWIHDKTQFPEQPGSRHS
jgi:hypothetical protein